MQDGGGWMDNNKQQTTEKQINPTGNPKNQLHYEGFHLFCDPFYPFWAWMWIHPPAASESE